MAISNIVARTSRRTLNPLIRPVAGWLPPLAVVLNRGRVSGRSYRTPVLAFRSDDGVLIVLFYGANTDWVRNVLAEGGCELRRRGRTIALAAPEVRPAASKLAGMPPPVGLATGMLGTESVLHATVDIRAGGSDRGEHWHA